VNAFLDVVGRWCARRRWEVVVAWVIILGALLGLRSVFGGQFHNDYKVTGSESAQGLSVLKKEFPTQGGYAGQIVFHAPAGGWPRSLPR
jgi:putative drug exporter of the RND superfamily